MATNIHAKRYLALNIAVLLALVGTVVTYSTSKENGTRVRNSFLLELADLKKFSLRPDELPDSFLAETLAPPKYLITEVERLIPPGKSHNVSILEQGKRIAAHLIENKKKGKPIRGSVKESYALIKNQGKGYCADYTQVFTALALTAGIATREWGFGFEDFGRGHAFNEIYDEKLRKWIFIDSFHSLYVVDRVSREPLSALEFQNRLVAEQDDLDFEIIPIIEPRYRDRFDSTEKAVAYYKRGAGKFYVFWGNNVFSYDDSLVVRLLSPISRSLEIFGSIVFDVQPKILVPETPTTAAHLKHLQQIRILLLLGLAIAGIQFVGIIYQLSKYRAVNRVDLAG